MNERIGKRFAANSITESGKNAGKDKPRGIKRQIFRRVSSLLLANMPLCLFVLLLFTASCSSVDCPLNSLVYTQYQLMTPEGKVDTLADTLTISTNRSDGTDSVLINKNVSTTEFYLPISYSQPQDVFFFETKDTLTGTSTFDTLTVVKEDRPHFESVDCYPLYFHTITAVSTTTNAVDSAVIINPDVSYDTSKKHIYIYFKHRD